MNPESRENLNLNPENENVPYQEHPVQPMGGLSVLGDRLVGILGVGHLGSRACRPSHVRSKKMFIHPSIIRKPVTKTPIKTLNPSVLATLWGNRAPKARQIPAVFVHPRIL
jgi:hypothetical protein